MPSRRSACTASRLAGGGVGAGGLVLVVTVASLADGGGSVTAVWVDCAGSGTAAAGVVGDVGVWARAATLSNADMSTKT